MSSMVIRNLGGGGKRTSLDYKTPSQKQTSKQTKARRGEWFCHLAQAQLSQVALCNGLTGLCKSFSTLTVPSQSFQLEHTTASVFSLPSAP